jgi:hypothetical protein
MPVKMETRTIAGLEVTSMQLPAMRALLLADQAMRFQELRGTELEAFTRQILATTSVIFEGQSVQLGNVDAINLVFSGDLGGLLQTIAFAVELNYASFFDGPAGSAGAGPEAKAPSPSTSMTTSPQPGPSGG